MAISFWCDCGRRLEVEPAYRGRRTTCPDCGADLVVPEASDLGGPGPDPDGPGPAGRRVSGLAVLSMALGLLSFGSWVSLAAWLFTAPPAVVAGSVALRRIRGSRGRLIGTTAAVMGIAFALMGTMFRTIIRHVPGVLAGHAAVQSNQCAGKLAILGAAFRRYEAKTDHFPLPAIRDAAGRPLLSWRVAILEDIDPALFAAFKVDEPWDSPSNRALLPRMPALYACPADAMAPRDQTRYRVVVGPSGGPGPHTAFEADRGVPAKEFGDGLRPTWMIVEAEAAVPWTKPDELAFTPAPRLAPPRDGERDFRKETVLPAFGSRHPRGFHALRGDGTVQFVGRNYPLNAAKARLTRDGDDDRNR